MKVAAGAGTSREPSVGIAEVREAFSRRRAPGEVLAAQSAAIARACLAVAERFREGGTLYAFGDGRSATDSQHVAVEFVHPVIVGKRALPALALTNDVASLTSLGAAKGRDSVFAEQLRVVSREGDLALGIGATASVLAGLAQARSKGMLTLVLTDEHGSRVGAGLADHVLTAATDDLLVAKEVHVTMYHVLWELVHVLFDDRGDLGSQPGAASVARRGADTASQREAGACNEDATCITCSDQAVEVTVTELLGTGLAKVETGAGVEQVSVALVDARPGDRILVHAGEAIATARTGGSATYRPAELRALYPFLYDEPRDTTVLLAEVARSTSEKATEIAALRETVCEHLGGELAACATDLAKRVKAGGRLFVFGNGGSSTDAAELAALFLTPPRGVPLPAFALSNDVATVTALANDIGVGAVFSRPLQTLAHSRDVAIGLSTSGGSANVVDALAESSRRGMLTIGLAGYEGGRMSELHGRLLEYLFVVPSTSVHRIQEAQTTLYHVLWELTQRALQS